ncbi:hypothetical protein RR48_10982 [Papilio machaon]|uniref:Chitin-binding type-2 domain-containing protein n=1 Tax=Papilio machaon TaxID=76193 RepID=A0A194RPW4_PAPMA|nr:hypothetical protein RR48_10982 [Papilio machaon]
MVKAAAVAVEAVEAAVEAVEVAVAVGGGGGGDSGGGGDGGGSGGGGGGGGGNGTCNCNPGEAPSICAAPDSDGVLVAHENCNQFYICAHGVPVAMRCPGNLLYDPYKEQCWYPEEVDCGDRVIPEDNGNGEGGGGGGGGTVTNSTCAPTVYR